VHQHNPRVKKHYAFFLKKQRWYSRKNKKLIPVDEYAWNTPRKEKKK